MKIILSLLLLIFFCVGCTQRTASRYAEQIRNDIIVGNLIITDVESKLNKPHSAQDLDENISTMNWEFDGEKPSVLIVYYNRTTKVVVNVAIAKPWAARILPNPQ